MSDRARERLTEQVRQVLMREAESGQSYPNLVQRMSEQVVEALLENQPYVTRAGWLLAYGRVHEVVEVDRQDGCYVTYTKDLDPDNSESEEDDE